MNNNLIITQRKALNKRSFCLWVATKIDLKNCLRPCIKKTANNVSFGQKLSIQLDNSLNEFVKYFSCKFKLSILIDVRHDRMITDNFKKPQI